MTQKYIRTFYTDGSCQGNPGPGGWAFVELNNMEKTLAEYDCANDIEDTTNNRMELTAILAVCELVHRDPDYDRTLYIVYSDSAYCVNLINEWMWTWAKNGWINSKKEEIANKDLVMQLYNYFKNPFCHVTMKKVKGHNSNLGNELADKLATGNSKDFNKLLKEADYEIDPTAVGYMRARLLKEQSVK